MCGILGLATVPARAQSVSVVMTTPDQTNLLTPQPSLAFAAGTANGTAISIDDTVRYQRLEGVGASFTDSAAFLVWNKLSPAQRTQLMSDLFSQGGIHLSFLRQPMGATDLALSAYTYDDVAAGGSDPNLTQFSIAHDQAYILPTLRAALAANPQIKVLALPWSPPAWMKTSGSLNGGTLDTANFSALAKYFTKFVQGYEANGVPINYVAAQNEPLYQSTGYPTMFMTPLDEGEFISRYLAPSLRGARLKNRGWNFDKQNADLDDATPGILGYEHNWDNPKYPELLLGDPAVRASLAGISFHCYAGNVADAQNAIHDLDPGTPIFFTECTGGFYAPDFASNLGNDIEGQVINVLRNWGKTVVMWNMALDQTGGPTVENGCTDCRGVVTIDTSTTPATVHKNVEYYALGHLAKYAQTGAYRIASNSFGSGNIEDVAFKNPDGSIVVLAYNGGSTPNTFSLNWHGETTSYTLPAGAVATFTWAGYSGSTYDVTAGPPSQTITPGTSTLYLGAVNRYGDNRPVKLSVGGLPADSFGFVFPLSLADNFEVPVLAFAGAPSGSYPVTITGTQGTTSRSSTVQLNITGPETPFGGAPATLPGTVQAENFDNGGNYAGYFNLDTSDASGVTYRAPATVGVENTADTGGGYDVGYTKEGEWLRYTVNVTQGGLMNLQARVASLGQGGYYHVSFDGGDVTGTMFVPPTGWWQNWTTQVSPQFQLTPGQHIMQVTFDGNGPTGGMGNFNWFSVQPVTGAGTAFGTAPAAVPGVIQAENFDSGGKNVAYFNGAASNGGGANYRPGETVYIESSSDTGGGYDVGQTQPGDWLNYTVDIQRAGSYAFSARVATDVGGGVFHLAVDGQRVTPPISVPQTNGWQTWQTLQVPDVALPSGVHTLQLVMDSGGFYNTVGNFNWISLK